MLRLYEDGTWYACWASDQDEASPKLTEEELLSSACDVLDKLGYTQAALAEWAWQDEEHWLTGAVKMTLDASGRLLDVYSTVLPYEEIDTVRTLPAERAASRHYSYPRGADEKMECFDVYELEVAYQRNTEAHLGQGDFLIPCWRLKGTVSGKAWPETISMIDYGF